MKTKSIFISEINELFENCKNNILKFSSKVENKDGLYEFYNKSLHEFYRLMPYYTFAIYFENLSYDDCMEVNSHGLSKSKELHDFYSQLFLQKQKALKD